MDESVKEDKPFDRLHRKNIPRLIGRHGKVAINVYYYEHTRPPVTFLPV